MRIRALSALAVAATIGCASGQPLEDFQVIPTTDVRFAPVCDLDLTVVDPELSLASELASDRWATATGCSVRLVPDGGVPIRFGTEAELTDDGTVGRGATHFQDNGAPYLIVFNKRYTTQEGGIARTLTHEIGHALGCWNHTDDGSILDSPSPSHGKITESALTCVCERLNCKGFNPEAAGF